MHKRKIFFAIAVLGLVLFGNSVTAQSALNPTTNDVVESSVPLSNTVYGIIAPSQRTKLAGRFDGVVKKIFYDTNDQFDVGEILVEFDCSIERAELEEARLSHQLEKLEYEDMKAYNKGAQESDEQRLETKALSVELRLAHLNYLREKVKYCKIMAPYAGRVTELFVSENEALEAWKDLIEIIDDKAVEFHFFLPVSLAAKIAIGHSMTVDVSNVEYKAVISYISIEADAIDNSYKAIAKIQDKKDIPLGVSGKSELKLSAGAGK